MKKKYALLLCLTLVLFFPACTSTSARETVPEILNVRPDQVTIAWTSLSPYKGVVHYTVAGNDAIRFTAEEPFGETLRHEVVLRGLEPGVSYTYQIGKEGKRYQFRTQPPSSGPFSFVVLSGNSGEALPSLSSEVFDFIVCTESGGSEGTDTLRALRSKTPVFDRLGPDSPYLKGERTPLSKNNASWSLDWGGLRVVFLDAGQDLPPLLQSAAPYAFGIFTSATVFPGFQQNPQHQALVEYNTKNPHRPVVFVLVTGMSLSAMEKDGIHYLGIPTSGESVVLRVDVDVESIRAVSLSHKQDYVLRQPPLGKQRTCGECRRLADRGAYEESIAAYRDFIANNQGHFQVDDAIFSIAEIYDEKLFRFKEAMQWYRRLTTDYPGGTLTPLAEQRLDYLRKYDDFEFLPLQRFERIRKVDYSRKAQRESEQLRLLGEVEGIVEEYPACRLAPVIRLWLANRYRQFSVEKAVAAFRLLRKSFPDAPEAKDVSFEIGAAYYQAERYSDAINALTRALKESPDKKKVIEGQIARSYRNTRRDIFAVACWALLAILMVLALAAKPFGLNMAGAGKILLMFVILTAGLVFAGYLIHEQFDSTGKMVLFAILFALDAALAALVSSSTASKLFDGKLWRAVAGSVLGLLFFAAGFYLIVYYLNVHYLVLVKL